MHEVITYDQIARGKDFVDVMTRRAGLDPEKVESGAIFGSGLDGFVEGEMDRGSVRIPFDEVFEAMGMPKSQGGVPGHAKELVVGPLKGTSADEGRAEDHLVIAQAGREHPYEGVSTQRATVWLRIMQLKGVQNLIGSNAAGIVTPETLSVSSLMLIMGDKDYARDFDNPLIGPNDERFGPRNAGMKDKYPFATRALIKVVAKQLEIGLDEGIYGRVKGPSYEPRELVYEFRALLKAIYGAACDQAGEVDYREDPVGVFGMSSTYEAEVAKHASLSKVHPAFKNRAWISALTNYAGALGPDGIVEENDHSEVKRNAELVQDCFQRLVRGVLLELRKS